MSTPSSDSDCAPDCCCHVSSGAVDASGRTVDELLADVRRVHQCLLASEGESNRLRLLAGWLLMVLRDVHGLPMRRVEQDTGIEHKALWRRYRRAARALTPAGDEVHIS